MTGVRQLRAEKLQAWACQTICKYREMETDDMILEVKYCPGCWLKEEATAVRQGLEDVKEADKGMERESDVYQWL